MAEKKLTTLLEIINYSTGLLNEKKIKDARLNVELMFCEILKCDRIKLYLDFDKPLQQEEIVVFKQMLKRRLNYEPLQYILGKTNFYGYRINVNNKVLIPRLETEILVDKILEDIYASTKNNLKILEIGTGSGSIAIALSGEMVKKNVKHKIISLEKSIDAIITAKENITMHNLSENIELRNEDFLNISFEESDFDYIISNPPYIPLEDMKSLEPEIKYYEPAEALTDGEDGLIFYKKIFDLHKNVFIKAKIFLEIGDRQKNKIEMLMKNYDLKDYIFFKDYINIDRVLKIN